MALGKRPRRACASNAPGARNESGDEAARESDNEWDDAGTTREKTDTRKRRKKDTKAAGNGKSAAASKAIGRGKKAVGKLAAVLDMPMDIFVAIASNMHPRDLLYLSRATKHFRNMFMTKESRLVWRAAFENVDVPEHPDALSEPLYAALLYDNHCMHCGENTRCEPNFSLCKRLCPKCTRQTIRQGWHFSSHDLDPIAKKIKGKLPVSLDTLCKRMFLTVHRKDPLTQSYSTLITNSDTLLSRHYYFPELEIAARKIVTIAKEQPAKLDDYVEAEFEKIHQIEQHSIEVVEWIEEGVEERKAEIKEKTLAFKSASYAKLEQCGYTKDDMNNVTCSEDRDIVANWRKISEQPKILTAKVWDNIRPKLEELIAQDRKLRYDRMVAKRRPILWRLLKDRVNFFEAVPEGKCSIHDHDVCPAEYIYISNVDYVKCKAVSAFMAANEGKDLYDGVKFLPDEAWDKLVEDGILESIDNWRHFAESVLNKHLVDGVTRIPNSAITAYKNKEVRPSAPEVTLPPSFSVHHPAAFFHTDRSYDPEDYYDRLLTYPGIITGNNACSQLLDSHADWKSRQKTVGGSSNIGPEEWSKIRSARRITYEGDRIAVQIALVLLQELGYDCEEGAGEHGETKIEGKDMSRKTRRGYISAKGMTQKGAVFVCMCCPKEGRMRRTWTELVSHFYQEARAFDEASKQHKRLREKATGGANMADSYLLRNPPINVHDFRTKQGVDMAIACEDAAFVNASCPYGEGVKHEHGRKLDVNLRCKICLEINGRIYDAFRSCYRRCFEMHLKARHGIHKCDEEVMEYV